MKTIKTLLVLFVLAIGSNAQAQTKEETITWLKEKLEKYINARHTSGNKEYKVTMQSINECEMVFIFTSEVGDKYVYILPTNIEEISEGFFIYSAKVLLHKINNDEYFSDSSGFIRGDTNEKLGLWLSDREDNIRERVEKALKHLATFCLKKKETF